MKLQKPPSYSYDECMCRSEDVSPCTIENNCLNALLKIECGPLCPAGEKCCNQNFRRGSIFPLEVKRTEHKGWGLFAKEEIPIAHFIIEYLGEELNRSDFYDRFNSAITNKNENTYFLKVNHNLYIDATLYGNESRFANHSCDPNAAYVKWTTYVGGQERTRIGIFALRIIEKVCLMNMNSIFSIGFSKENFIDHFQEEEITVDYKFHSKLPCRCETKLCRGFL